MKWFFGWPAGGHWRLLKPFRVTSRGLAVREGEDHGLVSAAKVGVGLELTLEIGPGPAPEASLGIVLEPTVKNLMVT